MKKWQIILIGIYVGFAIYSFGHCAANHPCKSWPSGSTENSRPETIACSLGAGLLWPLYLSWELQHRAVLSNRTLESTK